MTSAQCPHRLKRVRGGCGRSGFFRSSSLRPWLPFAGVAVYSGNPQLAASPLRCVGLSASTLLSDNPCPPLFAHIAPNHSPSPPLPTNCEVSRHTWGPSADGHGPQAPGPWRSPCPLSKALRPYSGHVGVKQPLWKQTPLGGGRWRTPARVGPLGLRRNPLLSLPSP